MDNNKSLKVIERISGEVKAAEVLGTDVRGVIEAELSKAGVTAEELYGCLKRGLRAKKMTVDKYGEEHIEEDYNAQHKYMMVGLELIGHLKAAELRGEGVMDKRIAEQILIEVRNVVVNNNYGGIGDAIKDRKVKKNVKQ